MAYIALVPKATRDLRTLSESTLRRIEGALDDLAAGAQNLDIKPLTTLKPWLRLRVGSYRVIYRRMTAEELRRVSPRAKQGFLVARIVDRKEQTRALRALGS